MKLTKKWLTDNKACAEGIKFFITNKLEGFPLEMLPQIKGDYNNYIVWVKDNKNSLTEYDENGNLIYIKYTGAEYHYTYNDDNTIATAIDGRNIKYSYEYVNGLISTISKDNQIYVQREYDSRNRLIKAIYPPRPVFQNELVETFEYDDNDNLLLMSYNDETSIKYQYDHNNNMIVRTHTNNGYGTDVFIYTHDEVGNRISENFNGRLTHFQVSYYPDGQLKQYQDLYIPYFEKDAY
jgi:hypothetical protein